MRDNPDMSNQDLNNIARTNWAALESIDDATIDYSDIPPLTDAFFENATLRIPATQAQDFQALLQQLRSGTEAEINAALADREVVEPEPELTPEVLERVRSVIAAEKRT
jgi:hypothetical protein